MVKLTRENIRDIVKKYEGMQCNCDLDNWQPTVQTGHSWVCRIHRAAIDEWNRINKQRVSY